MTPEHGSKSEENCNREKIEEEQEEREKRAVGKEPSLLSCKLQRRPLVPVRYCPAGSLPN